MIIVNTWNCLTNIGRKIIVLFVICETLF